jgi:GT2 family glycosyltransferase
VAALRNKGASESSGDILVFIDGDVAVTFQWGRELNEAINQLRKDPMQITGSICGITKQPGWLEQNWFDPALRKKPPTYINSGHLIVSRELFTLIRGFDETLETGEDVDFCERARMSGGTIVPNQQLAVIHKGYPRTLREFIRRERWHGKGDYSSYQKFVSSKPAIASVLSTSVLVIALLSSIVATNIIPSAIGLALFLGFCLMASIHRFGCFRTETIRGGLVYGIYFIARALSLVDVLLQKENNKPKQQNAKTKLGDQR